MTSGHLSRVGGRGYNIPMRSTTEPGAPGASRLLIALYSLFAVAAGSRAGFQLLTKWTQAPLAYSLSLLAALLYLLACVGLGRRTATAWRLALAVCAVELGGVLLVGTLSLVAPALFGDATVWSGFGAGYLFVPLLLPILGLAWLTRPATRRAYGADAGSSSKVAQRPLK